MKFYYLLLIASLVTSLQPFSFSNWVTNFGHFYQNDCKHLCPRIIRNPDENVYTSSLQKYLKCLYEKAHKITSQNWIGLYDKSFTAAVLDKAVEYGKRDNCVDSLNKEDFNFLFAQSSSNQTAQQQLPTVQTAQQPVSEYAPLTFMERILSLYNFNHYAYKGQCKKQHNFSLIRKFEDNIDYFKCLLGYVYCYHPEYSYYAEDKRLELITKKINLYWARDRSLSNLMTPYQYVTIEEIKNLEKKLLLDKKLEFNCDSLNWQPIQPQNTV